MLLKNLNLAIITFLFCILGGVSYSQTQHPIEWESLADTPWPIIKKDPQLTGRSEFVGPQSGEILWSRDMENGIYTGPIIGHYKNLFFGNYYAGYNGVNYNPNKNFYSLDSAGNIDWTFETEVEDYPPWGGLLMDADSTVYFTTGKGFLYAVTNRGELKWKKQLVEDFPEMMMINIDRDKNLYVCGFDNDSLYLNSVNPKGELNWRYNLTDTLTYRQTKRTSAAISPNGKTIYVNGNGLYALNQNGTLKWRYYCGIVSAPPMVDNQGNIYVGALMRDSSWIHSVNAEGELRWKNLVTEYGSDEGQYTMPTIDKNGNIYLFSPGTFGLYKFSYEGELQWTYGLRYDVWQPLICDAEGTIYLGSSFGGGYQAVSSDGELKWEISLGEKQMADYTGAIGKDGTLYIGMHETINTSSNMQNSLLAIKSDSVTSVNGDNEIVMDYKLEQNYPNPFNPATTIEYRIPKPENKENNSLKTTLKVYTILGEEVAALVDKKQNAGSYKVIFSKETANKELPSGVYIYKLSHGSFIDSRKMILLK